MTATYKHNGIPITEKKPNMTYNEAMKFWVSNVDDYDYKVEYLKFEEGTPFPEELHRRWHVAYAVDDLDRYADDADRIICGPLDAGPGVRLAFVEKDGAVLELYEDKNSRPPPARTPKAPASRPEAGASSWAQNGTPANFRAGFPAATKLRDAFSQVGNFDELEAGRSQPEELSWQAFCAHDGQARGLRGRCAGRRRVPTPARTSTRCSRVEGAPYPSSSARRMVWTCSGAMVGMRTSRRYSRNALTQLRMAQTSGFCTNHADSPMSENDTARMRTFAPSGMPPASLNAAT